MMPAGPASDADKSLRVLIVSADASLDEEFRGALSRVPDRQGVTYFADNYRQAVELATRRQPNLVLVEIDREAGEVAALSKDLQDLVPDAAIVGAFKQDRLEQGQSESATLIELLRAQLRDFLRRPVSATELRAVLDRLFARATVAHSRGAGRVAAFLSNKGGVGKSTLVGQRRVRTGASASRRGAAHRRRRCRWARARCCWTSSRRRASSTPIRERDRLDKTLLRHLTLRHGSGLRLLAAPIDALEGAEVDDEAIARIINMARRSFSYVIVDTLPILDSVLDDDSRRDRPGVCHRAGHRAGHRRRRAAAPGARRSRTAGGPPADRAELQLQIVSRRPEAGDIADRLDRTLEYVVPYERRVLTSMNTGSPHILHTRRWERFGRVVSQMIGDLDVFAVDGARDVTPLHAPVERHATNIGDRKEIV